MLLQAMQPGLEASAYQVDNCTCPSLLQDKYHVEPELLETVCPHCPSLVPKGYPIDLEPLWLHAMAYSGPGWAFEAPPPDWAAPEFVPKPRTAAASLARATLKQLSSAADRQS